MKRHDFRLISKEKHLEISSKGGLACHAGPNAKGFSKNSASDAGKKSAEKRAKISSWLDVNKGSYDDALDLAADCCSTFGAWKEDLSIPKFIMTKAKKLIK